MTEKSETIYDVREWIVKAMLVNQVGSYKRYEMSQKCKKSLSSLVKAIEEWEKHSRNKYRESRDFSGSRFRPSYDTPRFEYKHEGRPREK